MRKNNTSLKHYLKDTGIQPHLFSFFIRRFIKSESRKKHKPASLKFHLSQVLVAQAELIEYHLKRAA